jgi:hypothetical protein
VCWLIGAVARSPEGRSFDQAAINLRFAISASSLLLMSTL